MPSYDKDRRWYRDPPPGFVVVRDAEHVGAERWICRGTLLDRQITRSGLSSHAAACRAAWFAYDDAVSLGLVPGLDEELAEADVAIANGLAIKDADRRERAAGNPSMAEIYTVRLDSWDHMEAWLLCRIIDDAGSLRRAAKVIDVPRSTLGRRVRKHRDQGTWPR